tara:strand:+ start:2569 stop:3771 length:1203 start_codon:yes stop_codon:yes gene_type:complete
MINEYSIWFWAFIISAASLIHTYLLFPILLKAIVYLKLDSSSVKKSDDHITASIDQNDLPKITVIVAAYNEESILDSKILNFETLNYPRDKLEIIIGSDGSTDRTEKILQQAPSFITSVINQDNLGKAAVLNQLVELAKGEILVFCDANTILLENTLLKLSQHFINPKIGCVSGRLILRDSGDYSLSEGESIYWTMESEIKRLESKLGVLMGVNGALYALRSELFVQIPTYKPVMDDFWVCIKVLRQNYQVLYETAAIGIETTSADALGEFKRKIRIGQANFNFLPHFMMLLRPWAPVQAITFFSHKLLRWLAPHFLLIMLVSSFAIQNFGFTIFGLLQLMFYLIAYLSYLLESSSRKIPFGGTAYYFSVMNLALLIGFFQAFKPSTGGAWERVPRNEKN